MRYSSALGHVLWLVFVLLGGCSSPGTSGPVVQSVGPAGGTVVSSDKRFSLEIPAGALSSTIDVGIDRLPPEQYSAAVKALRPSDVYKLTPDGTTFAVPVIVRLALPANPNSAPGVFKADVVVFATEAAGVVEELAEAGIEFGETSAWRTELKHFSNVLTYQGRGIPGVGSERGAALIRASVEFPYYVRLGEPDVITIRLAPDDPAHARFRDGLSAWANIEAPAVETNLVLPGLTTTPKSFGKVGGAFYGDAIMFTMPISCSDSKYYPKVPAIHVALAFAGTGGPLTKPDGSDLYLTYTVRQISLFFDLSTTCAQGKVTAGDDTYSVGQDQKLTVAAPGLVSNDAQPGSTAPLGVDRVTTPPSHGSVTTKPDGSFEYTPTAGFSGEDSFDYVASDGVFWAKLTWSGPDGEETAVLPGGPETDEAHVTIKVGPVAPPVAGVWEHNTCTKSGSKLMWAFWPNGAVVNWYAPIADDGIHGCRTGYNAPPYDPPHGHWSLDATGRMVVEYCGTVQVPKSTSTFEFTGGKWKNIAGNDCLWPPTKDGNDYSMKLWRCVASDVGCVNVTRACNGAVDYTGPLVTDLCYCGTQQGCPECIPLYANATAGHWDFEAAITPVCP